MSECVAGVVAVWLVGGARAGAAAAMTAYLLRANPRLIEEARDREYREP
jgi:hypothetical protein